MRVLVACESSGRVRDAFRAKGHEAWSCDVLPCDADAEHHLQCDVLGVLGGDWDMVLAFPPCTHLASSGARWFAEKRKDGRQQQGIDFFMAFTEHRCPLVAIENPVGIMSTVWRKPDQIIQPWQYGHGETKKTCLWLRGLPLLRPTSIVAGREHRVFKMPPSPDRAKLRSVTYAGVAAAMADQWGQKAINAPAQPLDNPPSA